MTVLGKLIVSCQAGPGHPLRDTPTIVRMAQAAVLGGARAIRCGGAGGLDDVRAVAAAVDVPVIGLTKRGREGVFITPTVADALAVLRAGATIVAADGTTRPRPDGALFVRTVEAVHAEGGLVMADVSTEAEGLAAAEAGADLIATTLSGYTPASPVRSGPDLDLVAALARALPSAVVVAEGRYHQPAQVRAALAAGASSVVVGTAITDPAWITGRFAAGLEVPSA
ncbi:N-acetylmannosamine-6-phosphate 2-epimerase [Actinoplanes sp. L3-i22]|uniref:N-acetylmannosamine-6-phosphate 2-epimerase n=1 Tax=Actinoplanes sp. L3-i22 TaxID=2836373 RepID=UPI001C793CA8|nr:putative N-acetylmannosamine-6-phosphate 2-epimerase [Actinoplanes sp. L3-i22]BCY09862.1 putative N-acetylmannosamine-6-phosphate 2-epimerase [Actinoplanes sp. L3-i22]